MSVRVPRADRLPAVTGSAVRVPTIGAALSSGTPRYDDGPPIRDLGARLVFSPIFGVAIPNLSGMIDHGAHSTLGIVASYAYFTAVAFLVWEGNRRLHYRFRATSDWFRRPWKRVAVILGALCLYTIPFSLAMLWLWARVTGDPAAQWPSLSAAVLIVVICTTIVTHAYETVYLVRGWESDRLRNEVLRRERLEAELEALKMQVDPHVLFNQLHALAHLLESGQPAAADYLQALADSYRYLLKTRRLRAVSLAEELALLERFATLAEIRLPPGALRLQVEIPEDRSAALFLPPVTLPELLDNAVKHNAASAEQPLVVTVRLEADRLVVSNALRPTLRKNPSTQVGLANLAERVRLTTRNAMLWEASSGQFTVSVPLISRAEAEASDAGASEAC